MRLFKPEGGRQPLSELELFLYEYEVDATEIAGDVVARARQGEGVRWGLAQRWSRSELNHLPSGVHRDTLEVKHAVPQGFPPRTYVLFIARVTDAEGRTASDSWGFAAGAWPSETLPIPLMHGGPLSCRISVGFAAAESICPSNYIRCECPSDSDDTECTQPAGCNCRDGLSGYFSPRDMLSDPDFQNLIFDGYPSSNGVALAPRAWQFYYLTGTANRYRLHRTDRWNNLTEHAAVEGAAALLKALGVMHRTDWKDTNLAASPNLFTAEPKNWGTAVHETAHRVFQLSDEYPGSNVLPQPAGWEHPNVYDEDHQGDCDAYNTSHNLGPCTAFRDANGDTWYSSERQPPLGAAVCRPETARAAPACVMWNDCDAGMPPFGPTCLRRIAWYYQTQLPQPPFVSDCTTLPPHPELVQKRIVLFRGTPGLLVKVLASEVGYSLVASRSVTSAPLVTTDMGGDVLVTARDEHGNILSRSSTRNPRTRYGTTAVHDPSPPGQVEFAVILPHPERVRSVEFEVRRGPNRFHRSTFHIRGSAEGARSGSQH